jgi:hypothetical protein
MLKGTVSRDFLLSVFFINQPDVPDKQANVVLHMASEFAEIIASKVTKIGFNGVIDTAEIENYV